MEDPARQALAALEEALAVLSPERAPQGVLVAARRAERALTKLCGATPDRRYPALRQAVRSMGSALDALAPHTLDAELGAATEAVAQGLAILYPMARAAQRKLTPAPDAPASDGVFASLPPAPPRARRTRKRTAGSSERRADERFRVEVDLGLLSDSCFYTGLSGDVSRGGLFVATYQPKPPGTRVQLNFVLPNGHAIQVSGSVRWTSPARGNVPPGMGIAFDDLSGPDRHAVEEFCKLRAPLYHPALDD